ncbi:MAG: aldo/keto reductase [Anaerolineae bacterium]|nr:aldo/keto reductase [Anaerolineae bacterium]
MKYRLLGKSGLRVSELALGTMTFGEDWGWGASKEASRQQFDLFVEQGGNFIDTAINYTEGTAEKYVGEFVKGQRERFVIATKYSLVRNRGDVNGAGNNRKNLMHSLDHSLKSLGVDYLDLFWLHAWDFTTPVEEIMRGLDDAVRAGKVLYVGISDTPAWIVSRANAIAELRGWSPFIALQIEYSLIERTPERDLLPMAQTLELGVTPWAALGGGVLTGKYLKDPQAQGRINDSSPRRSERNTAIATEVVKIAEEIGRPAAQVAINWVMRQPAVVSPIIGARSAEQLKESLAAAEFTLTPEQLARLDAVSQIDLGFPHDFLARDNIRDILSAGMFREIDVPRRRG